MVTQVTQEVTQVTQEVTQTRAREAKRGAGSRQIVTQMTQMTQK